MQHVCRYAGERARWRVATALVLVLFALLPAPAGSQEPATPAVPGAQAASQPPKAPAKTEAQNAYTRCIDDSDGTNVAWARCGGDLIARADKRLNAAWQRAFAGRTPDIKAALLDEQRAWLAFRDKSCLVYSTGAYGREGQVLSFPNCLAGIIDQRTAFLNEYADDQ